MRPNPSYACNVTTLVPSSLDARYWRLHLRLVGCKDPCSVAAPGKSGLGLAPRMMTGEYYLPAVTEALARTGFMRPMVMYYSSSGALDE